MERKADSLTNSQYPESNVFFNPKLLSGRMGESGERKNSKMAEQAVCKPSLTVVPTYEPNDPSIFFFPRCTRVNRCGGCCGSQLLSCEAKETETQNFEVRQLDKCVITDEQYNHI